MFLDAREIDHGSIIEGDLCIVGAGASGLSIALDWIGTHRKVILLEGGGFDFDLEMQKLYEGKNVGRKYYNLMAARMHAFGGTTGYWGGFCSPLDPIDFQQRNWVPNSGWPIDLKDLQPHFKTCSQLFDLETDNFDLSYWLKQGLGQSLVNDDGLFYHKMWQFSPPTRFGSKYSEIIKNAENIHLYTYANVTQIFANESKNAIKEVEINNLAGKKHLVRAKYFVLACGAIQNARLLLASKRDFSEGVGNEYDNVGRYFMDHIEIDSGELWLTEQHEMQLYLRNGSKTKARAEFGLKQEAQEQLQVLNGTISLKPLTLEKNNENFMERFDHVDPSKRGRKLGLLERVKNRLNKISKKSDNSMHKAYSLYTRMEQSPNRNSRVFLDRERDALGVPKIILNWEITQLEKRSIRSLIQTMGKYSGYNDVGRTKLLEFLWNENDGHWPDFLIPGLHHIGTTRMSLDPKKGVVDQNCKIHNLENLFVAGSSCFPTSGAANPTFTIAALSLRLSQQIKACFK